MRNAKANWVGEEKKLSTNLFENDFFQLTNNLEDFLPSKEIEEWLKQNHRGVSMAKFGVDMKKHCRIKKYEHIKSEVKSIDGKNTRGWCGLRKKGGLTPLLTA